MSTKTKKYVMVIDLRKCVGCHACTVKCKMENDVPEGHFRTWVVEADVGVYPNVTRAKLPRLWNHCDDAPCVTVCPVNANKTNEHGIVTIDKDACIGCRYCIAACPYDARYLNPETGIADKCDFCLSRVENGLMPACVSTCITHSRVFGDINDPNSEVSKLLSKHATQVLNPEHGTQPNVYYIGLDATLSDTNFQVIRDKGAV